MKLCSPVPLPAWQHIISGRLWQTYLGYINGYNFILVLLLLSLLQTNIYICGSSRRRSGGHKTKPAGVGQLAGNPSLCPQCVYNVWCGVWQFWTNPSLCPQCVVWCGVSKYWTNSSLCLHSGLNKVYNVGCLQILNQPLLHCVAYKFCSNPWFCLHSDRNLPFKDFAFFGNSFFWVLCV